MLTDKDRALLTTRLQAPLIIEDILSGKSALTDEAHYGLHALLSDFQPDTALLAIAASAEKIAFAYAEASPGMSVLALESKRLLEEYGPLWLQNAHGQTIDATGISELLGYTAEDLEGLAELLEINGCFLRGKDPQAAAVFEILAVQASAQAMIAEEFLLVADQAGEVYGAHSLSASSLNDNVIAFPVMATARA
jgi:hypothetical protein